MPHKFKVVVTDFIADRLEAEKQILGDIADVAAFDALNEDELLGRIEDTDAIMVYHNLGLTRKTIERLEHCKLIIRCGVGVDNVDHALARQRGIPVANVPDYGTEEVADSAIGLMLAFTRGLSRMNSLLRGHRSLDVHPSRAVAPPPRPGVRHRRPGTHRHRRRAAGEGPGDGRRVLRSLQADRL